MKYLSLALFSVTLIACNVNNEATTKVDISEVNKKYIVKGNTTDTINFDISNNTSVEVSNNKALECHNTIPDWQAKELAEVPCFELPISVVYQKVC